MTALAKEIRENTLLKSNGIFNFCSKINFHLEISSYILKTAETPQELIESFKLRHEVFYQEFQNIDTDGLDVDQYDSHFDHLIIIHKESKKVIGTYRLNCSNFSMISYTENEFDLTEIYKMQGPHLELGRACIHKDHRKGATVISLLWRGIIEYMNTSGANVLFGCSSIKVNNTRDAALIYKYLSEKGSVLNSAMAKPVAPFKMADFESVYQGFQGNLNQLQSEEAEKLIPSLLKSYIRYGSKIASEPALDKDFDCIDLLTVMKKEDIQNSLVRRFQVVQ